MKKGNTKNMDKILDDYMKRINQLQNDINDLKSQIYISDCQKNISPKKEIESLQLFGDDDFDKQEYDEIVSKSFENTTQKQKSYTREQFEDLKKILMINQGIKDK
ncbi:hypothetical protein [Clostridium perfringens]|uniref:hypothetical protein n=1 Tax=Clostridium perfringens TaxID=1502 RepID=UPI0034A49A89